MVTVDTVAVVGTSSHNSIRDRELEVVAHIQIVLYKQGWFHTLAYAMQTQLLKCRVEPYALGLYVGCGIHKPLAMQTTAAVMKVNLS